MIKNKDFYQKTLYDNFKPLLPQDEANYLSKVLTEKLSYDELNVFLLNPIIVVNGEYNERVDNSFIKRQLLKKGNYDALANLNKAKIIICNCENISVIGLDVVYLFGNNIRLICPEEQAEVKNEVLLAKNNKIINSVNITYRFSVGNALKNVMHNEFDKVVDTRMLNISPTTIIECDTKEVPFKLKRDFYKSPDGGIYTVYNPISHDVQLEKHE